MCLNVRDEKTAYVRNAGGKISEEFRFFRASITLSDSNGIISALAGTHDGYSNCDLIISRESVIVNCFFAEIVI